MTAPAARAPAGWSPTDTAVLMLQVYCIALICIPSDVVLGAVGAAGYVSNLLAMTVFAAYWGSVLLGLVDFRAGRTPVRTATGLLWVASLIAYAYMHSVVEITTTQGLAADRWLMQLMAVTGVIHVAGELLPDIHAVRRVLKAFSWGTSFMGVVAALQFWAGIDVTWVLRLLPGFTVNYENTSISSRGALSRVAGTAIHPIELGAVAAMALPLVVWLAMTDRSPRPLLVRWGPVVLTGLALPASVSRSAVLSVAISMTCFVLMLPPLARITALAATPVAVVAVFMSTPGLISTLYNFFAAGTSDPSVATRVDDYPFVEELVSQRPWFGQGGATFIPTDAFQILDNQYLKTAIELGAVGLLTLVVFLFAPACAALVARSRTADPDLRLLCAALCGASVAAAAASVTFDSLSFPMFVGVHALVAGLVGCCFRLTRTADGKGKHLREPRSAVPSGGTVGARVTDPASGLRPGYMTAGRD